MTFICAVNPLFIALPVIFAQYVLATFTLVRLARSQPTMRVYALWNVVIMLVFFVGSIAFLLWDNKRKKRLRLSPGADAQSGKDAVSVEQTPHDGEKIVPAEATDEKARESETDESMPAQGGSKWDV